MYNVVFDIVLYLLSEGWNMSLIYDGTFPFQYLQTQLLLWKILLVQKLGCNLFFWNELHLCESEGLSLNKDLWIYDKTTCDMSFENKFFKFRTFFLNEAEIKSALKRSLNVL